MQSPRINGAPVFGVRPGSPFLYKVPATGDRPITFAADGLPAGLTIDANTGLITGALATAGEYTVTLRATNAAGTAERPFRIIAGDQICLTPPLGWNHWNAWGTDIDDAKIRAAARQLVETGLAEHGWTYINIDDGWQGKRDPVTHALQSNERFPDMKGLCDYVHSLGLKVGIYSTPWKWSYGAHPGGSADTPDGQLLGDEKPKEFGPYSFHAEDVRQWAEWGIDYLKYDWHTLDPEHTKVMGDALKRSGRDIVYSLSNSAPFEHAEEWVELANAWRTTPDIVDRWNTTVYDWHWSVEHIALAQERWAPYAGPGHWPDADMLVLGILSCAQPQHPTNLTPAEQRTHVTLWTLFASPLLIGCDLTRIDPVAMELLTNDEVLAVHQDELGHAANRVIAEDGRWVWRRSLADGAVAVALVNPLHETATVKVSWSELGLPGARRVRDLWTQADVAGAAEGCTVELPAHGCALLRIEL